MLSDQLRRREISCNSTTVFHLSAEIPVFEGNCYWLDWLVDWLNWRLEILKIYIFVFYTRRLFICGLEHHCFITIFRPGESKRVWLFWGRDFSWCLDSDACGNDFVTTLRTRYLTSVYSSQSISVFRKTIQLQLKFAVVLYSCKFQLYIISKSTTEICRCFI